MEPQITGTLEDYIETIYLIVKEKKIARVRDITKALSVKAASVTPALKRLANLGLIKYTQRDFIDLTEVGETLAKTVLEKHNLLTMFFEEVLQVSHENAIKDACSMEHFLSEETRDKLKKFIEVFKKNRNK